MRLAYYQLSKTAFCSHNKFLLEEKLNVKS